MIGTVKVEEEGSSKILKHDFKIKITVGAYEIMEEISRQFVTLVAPPHEFNRKSITKGNETKVSICSECDALGKTVRSPVLKQLRQ